MYNFSCRKYGTGTAFLKFCNNTYNVHAIGIFITCVYNETESRTFSL